MVHNINESVGDALEKIKSAAVGRSVQKPPDVQRKCDAVVTRYGDFASFMKKFSSDVQEKAGQNIDAVFSGSAPTLAILNQTYGSGSAETFLACHICIVQNFCGIPKKLTEEELFNLGKVIASSFYYLKTSELCLFFLWLKTGKYGKFYGCIDPMVITNGLQQFAKERVDYITAAENRKHLEEKEQLLQRTNAITYSEYKEYLRKHGL